MAETRKPLLVATVSVLVLAATALVCFIVFDQEDPAGAVPFDRDHPSTEAGSDVTADIEADRRGADDGGAEKVPVAPVRKTSRKGQRTGDGLVTGRVLDGSDRALEGAAVYFVDCSPEVLAISMKIGQGDFTSSRYACAFTGPDGAFRLEQLAAGEDASLYVDHEDHAVKRVPVGSYGGDVRDMGTITLETGGRISGRVLIDGSGEPVAGALVKAVGLSGYKEMDTAVMAVFGGMAAPEQIRTAESGPDGAFRLKGLPAGKAVLSVEHKDYPPAESLKIDIVKGRTMEGVELLLDRPFSISGTVLCSDGEPLEAISLSVQQAKDVDLSNSSAINFSILEDTGSLSGPDGAFEIGGIGKGTYTVKAKGGIYLPRSIEGVEAGTSDLVIVLERGGVVHGRVLDSRSGEGVEDFKLVVSRQAAGSGEFAGLVLTGEEAAARTGGGTDPRGAFFVEGVGEVMVRFKITAPGYADLNVGAITSSAGARSQIDFELEREGSVAGTLLSPDGEPLHRGTVVLQVPKEDDVDTLVRKLIIGDDEESLRKPSWEGRAKSGSAGDFLFSGVPEGEYRLNAYHDDFVEPDPLDLYVAAAETKKGIVLRMRRGGTVEGTVFGRDGQPVPGAKVRAFAQSSATSRKRDTTADGDGNYAFTVLRPGEYSLTLDLDEPVSILESAMRSRETESAQGVRVSVGEGETVRVDLHDVPPGTITGSVTEAGLGVPGIEVQLMTTSELAIMPVKTCRTDKNGRYVMEDVKSGEYQICLSLGELPDLFDRKVTLYPRGRIIENFELPTGRIVGRVVEAGTGTPVADIVISVIRLDVTGKAKMKVTAASVSISSSEDGGDRTAMLEVARSGPILTDREGRFEIPHLMDGKYCVTASGGSYSRERREPVIVKEGSVITLPDIGLSGGALLRGRVINLRTGETVSNCPLLIVRLDEDGEPGKDHQFVLCGKDGSFEFTGLAAGRYQLMVPVGGYKGELQVAIDGGDEKSVDFEVVPSF